MPLRFGVSLRKFTAYGAIVIVRVSSRPAIIEAVSLEVGRPEACEKYSDGEGYVMRVHIGGSGPEDLE